MRNLIILFFLAFFSASGQQQVTHFEATETRKYVLHPVGQVENFFYVITPDRSISKIDVNTNELTHILTLPADPNRNFDAVVIGKQLYFYNAHLDSNRVILYRADPENGSYEKILTIDEARSVTKNGSVLYVARHKGLLKVDLEKGPVFTEDLLPENRVDGSMALNTIFKILDPSSNNQVNSAFLDENHVLHKTGLNSGTLRGQDCGDFIIFSYHFNPKGYFIFDKSRKEFKPLTIKERGVISTGVLSDFFEENGRQYAVYNYREGTDSVLGLYELVNDELTEIFSAKAPLSLYYNDTHPAAGAFVPAFYSNFPVKDAVVYFWANSSNQYTPNFDLRLCSMDLQRKEFKSVALNNPVLYDELNRSTVRNSLYISKSAEGVVTHSLKREIINFEYNTVTGEFRKSDVYAPYKVYKTGESSTLNFSYPDRVIASGPDTSRLIESTAQVKRSPIERVSYFRDKIYLVDYDKFEFHLFDGEQLKTVKLELENDFKQVRFWDMYETGSNNYFMVVSHGVRQDDKEGGYIFLCTLDSKEILHDFEAEYNSPPVSISGPAGPMTLVNIVGGDYIYTDLSPQNTLVGRELTQGGMELIHPFNSEAAVVRGAQEIFYYNFKTRTRVDLTGWSWDVHGHGDKVYYRHLSDLYSVNSEGVKTKIASLGDQFLSDAEDVGTYLLYRLKIKNAIAFLNKATGKYVEFRVPDVTGLQASYLKLNGEHYLITTGKIIRLRIETGEMGDISTGIKEALNPTVYKDMILFHEPLSEDHRKKRIWAFRDSKLNVLVNEFETNDGNQALNQPQVFRNKTTMNHAFWIPEKGRMFYFEDFDFRYNEYFHFMASAGGSHYFNSYNSGLRKYQIFRFDIEQEAFSVFPEDDFMKYAAIYAGMHPYYVGNNKVWKVTENGLEDFTDLKPVTMGGTSLFELKNNYFVWATDGDGVPQIYQLTDNEAKEDVVLSAESPALHFTFYPNPTQDYLNISSTSESRAKYKVTVISTEGKVLSEQNLSLPGKIDLSKLTIGVYLINVKTGSNSKTFRVLKQ